MIAFLACSIICFCSFHFKGSSSFGDVTNGMTRYEAQDQFGSFAWSIMNPNAVDGTHPKDGLLTQKSQTSVILHETKFHTVPSICGMDSYILVDLLNKKDASSVSSPKTSRAWKTWTGHIHWIWETWDIKNVRRARTTMASSSSSPGPRFASLHSLSTKRIPNIPLDVDYKNEIEPNLGELLGEGGFGQVYFAKWKDQSVAVKVRSFE